MGIIFVHGNVKRTILSVSNKKSMAESGHAWDVGMRLGQSRACALNNESREKERERECTLFQLSPIFGLPTS